MLEISASMESKAKSSELMETTDADFADISFEELLAREKKDSFWYAQVMVFPLPPSLVWTVLI